jgi:hypothetical protein
MSPFCIMFNARVVEWLGNIRPVVQLYATANVKCRLFSVYQCLYFIVIGLFKRRIWI